MKLTDQYLDKQRKAGDMPADKLVSNLFSEGRQSELYHLLQNSDTELADKTPVSPILDFLHSRKKNPSWYDASRLLRGQHVFGRYAEEIMMLLGAKSLPYCYAASPGNKALYASEKMRKNSAKRLLDTANFVIAVATPGSLTETTTGQLQINRTRLVHAIARHYVLKGEWDPAWGLPVNQEDMAGTNLAFSVVVLIGLAETGIQLTEQEREDFIYLWRYIGYQLNIDTNLLPADFKEAFALANIIKKRNFKSSEEGIVLTRELLNYYRSVTPPEQARFIDSQVRYYLGREIAGYVGLQADPMSDSIQALISELTAIRNIFKVHLNSYQRMLRNHQQLKRLITGSTPA